MSSEDRRRRRTSPICRTCRSELLKQLLATVIIATGLTLVVLIFLRSAGVIP